MSSWKECWTYKTCLESQLALSLKIHLPKIVIITMFYQIDCWEDQRIKVYNGIFSTREFSTNFSVPLLPVYLFLSSSSTNSLPPLLSYLS